MTEATDAPLVLTREVAAAALARPRSEPWWTPGAARPAAVVVPLRLGADPYVVAILRSSSLREHSGEVAFPGGKVEATDADLRAAAYRELGEEVGITPPEVTDLGMLSPVPVVTGRYVIHPFVAELADGAEPRITSGEIARLLRIPLAPWITGERSIGETRSPWRGHDLRVPHFVLDGCTLYGASAFVFFELLCKVAAALGRALPPAVTTDDLPWGTRYPR